MGASWRRAGAAVLLLVLAAALAPAPAQAGTAADPEVSDPAGDQVVDQGPLIVPGVNDAAMDDVDVVAAWVEERTHDCVGEAPGTCPAALLVVQTTAAWSTGTMTIGFTVKRGPTSLPSSTATDAGTPFTLTISGATVTGLDNATAVSGADGLRITLPLPRLGAVGGDLLTDLTISTTRTDTGLLQGVAQDDQTGTDEAGPGRAYTFARPPVNPQLLLDIVTIDGKTGAVTVTREDATVPVVLRVTNVGLDPDRWGMSFQSTPPLEDPPLFTQALIGIAPGASADTTINLSLKDVPEGRIALAFTATSERGATTTARATLTIDLPSAPAPPPTERETKPAGLTFLTTPAEAAGFDNAFGSYAELAFLALIVLLVIVVIFLLLSLGRSTLDHEPAVEAPWPAERAMPAALAGPGGIAETVRATPAMEAEPGPSDEDGADATDVPADFGALMAAAQELAEPATAPAPMPVPTAPAGMRIRIEEVRHTPREPAAGEAVTTEVLLRNEGVTATLRIALSIDGRPAAERIVQVPSRATKAVELPWTAGPGDNRVKIQAFPA